MGYACPVCETPQRDGEHLAHHLAFTAMLHSDDHEAWLDDRVPDWADRDPDGLAAAVTPHAEEAEYHEVFEDTVDRGRPDVDLGDHDHAGHGHAAPDATGRDTASVTGVVDESSATDPETAAAMREARELTREMFEGDESHTSDEADADGDAADADGDADADTADSTDSTDTDSTDADSTDTDSIDPDTDSTDSTDTDSTDSTDADTDPDPSA